MINTEIQSKFAELSAEIQKLREENKNLAKRVSDLEIQTGQLTDRVLRSSGGCSSCGV